MKLLRSEIAANSIGVVRFVEELAWLFELWADWQGLRAEVGPQLAVRATPLIFPVAWFGTSKILLCCFAVGFIGEQSKRFLRPQ